MKQRITAVILTGMVLASLFTGCAKNSSVSDKASGNDYAGEAIYGEAIYGEDLNLEYSEGLMGAPDINVKTTKEMLVYRCNISLDTLNFEETVTSLKSKVNEYHGFIVEERESDGSSDSSYYITADEDKDLTYTATLRIPSEYYESFVNSAEGLGQLKSKNSSVDNMTTVYGTLKAELEIYEAEYNRYLDKLDKIEDDKLALEVEKELRDLAIKIADIKTSLGVIENDVAYSYVTIRIHRVHELVVEEEKPVDNSFKTRLKKTAVKSWKNCLAFLQGIVLFIIKIWWFLVFCGINAIIVVLIVKTCKKRKTRKKQEQRAELEAREAERIRLAEEARAAMNAGPVMNADPVEAPRNDQTT